MLGIYVRPKAIEQAIEGIKKRGASSEENLTRISLIKEEHQALEILNSQHYFDYTYTNRYDETSMQGFLN